MFLFLQARWAAVLNDLYMKMFIKIPPITTTMFIDQVQSQRVIIACFINVFFVQHFVVIVTMSRHSVTKTLNCTANVWFVTNFTCDKIDDIF